MIVPEIRIWCLPVKRNVFIVSVNYIAQTRRVLLLLCIVHPVTSTIGNRPPAAFDWRANNNDPHGRCSCKVRYVSATYRCNINVSTNSATASTTDPTSPATLAIKIASIHDIPAIILTAATNIPKTATNALNAVTSPDGTGRYRVDGYAVRVVYDDGVEIQDCFSYLSADQTQFDRVDAGTGQHAG